MSETPKDAKSIFLAALDIQGPAERAAFVARSCEGDDPLQKRVEDLLRAYGESGGPLDKLAAAIAPTQLGEPIREQVGSTIGPYKLMEQIGEGGFGLVFVAEQQQPIRRKVALKIIKPGMDTRDVIARFEAERQALALMDHPNIARVLDAGTTESGRPYFVMELVRGIPITEYCDQAQLTPRERLELFVPVCNAIQHAHLKGIIHRDVKPSNVLITLHDDQPVVKVIDFGVAKALYQSLTERTIYTRYAQMIGTPLYMSPEQAQMSGLDIDTRSDIYSLGVLLYELLTGSTPFNKERLARAAYDELLKIIREEEPPKPSVRLSQSTDTLPSIAAQRKTEPAKLSKMFSGDLDWIAMKALEKDRTRRYETANAFAADVMRYLNDEPVEASPPSAAYRIRKFTRKHRGPVIALAAIMTILVLGIAGTTWGLFRAQRAEQAADLSKQQAIEALAQTTKERDAKERALAEEQAQRDHAERELARGLLRPIGFGDLPQREGGGLGGFGGGIGGFGRAKKDAIANPAELRSFVDWSSIKDSQLKTRVLEIAFEDPETALRVARRSEQVIQAAIGVSPKRRTRAIEFISARQRDRTADPRIRVGACWLALELGSVDLPAWAESCSYLGGQNKLAYRFVEFVDFATRRQDPGQLAQLSAEPLLVLLETPTHAVVWGRSCNALFAVESRLDSEQAKRAFDALVRYSTEKGQQPPGGVDHASELLGLLAARSEQKRVADASGALISRLEKVLDDDVVDMPRIGMISSMLNALLPRLDKPQAAHVADTLTAMLEKLRGGNPNFVSSHPNNLSTLLAVLKPLAPRLEPKQAAHIADILASIAAKPPLVMPSGMVEGFSALEPVLEDADLRRIANGLIAGLPAPLAIEALTGVAKRMQSAQAASAWERVLKLVSNPHPEDSMIGPPDPAPDALKALALRLEPRRAVSEAGILIPMLSKSNDPKETGRLLIGLIALTPRMEPSQVKRAATALIAQMQKMTNDELADTRFRALKTMSPRLEPTEAKRAWEALVAMLPNGYVEEALALLSPRLTPPDVESAGDMLIALLEKPTPEIGLSPHPAGFQELIKLAPRLKRAQITRAMDAVIKHVKTRNDLADGLVAAAFHEFAPLSDQAQIVAAADSVTATLTKTGPPQGGGVWGRPGVRTAAALDALLSRLGPDQISQIGNELIVTLESSTNETALNGALAGLVAVAPRLAPLQIVRAWKTMSAIPDKMPNVQVWHGLAALAPGLEPTSRDNDAKRITAVLLDYSCCDVEVDGSPEEFARCIPRPRSLATLLSHPGCVSDLRRRLLDRFEELVFYDGKAIFPRPQNRGGFGFRGMGESESEAEKKPGGPQPPARRFHNLADAAAWIQQNWPDFDLETNCPATWRGSR
ncbi:MAG TPA: protein kinase [Planctomycetaceae bacterium]|jgi:serine/threonine protein kinase|nr:protein kinase [Planctomycetaceae bacterium]